MQQKNTVICANFFNNPALVLANLHSESCSTGNRAAVSRCTLLIPLLVTCMLSFSITAQETLVAGANVNMVSGTGFPGGDPFLQRQNEPSLAVSTRNILHLLGGANDYRTVDIPGLPDGKAVGDSWPGVFSSVNGGSSWVSTLLPGFPQDTSGASSPLFGYEAGADPVIRAGTNGLFYYSGIVFDRGHEQASAAFVARFMDLNNDPRITKTFEEGPIRHIDTKLVDRDPGGPGSEFIDKPWMAVDIPRPGSQRVTLNVPQGGGTVPQTIDCGNVYLAYSRIAGEDTSDIDTRVMFTRSTDCGETFDAPFALDGADRTVNQGVSVAVDPGTGHVYVAWRQFNSATLSCTRDSDFWQRNPAAWPVESVQLGADLYTKAEAINILKGKENSARYVLARELIVAKLNVIAGADDGDVADVIALADTWVAENGLAKYAKKGTKNKDVKSAKTAKNTKEVKPAKIDEKEIGKFLQQYNTGFFGPGSCDDFVIDGNPGDSNPDAIMVVRSTDSGATFSAPTLVSELIPFDQNTTKYTFRSNSYPTMAIDDSGRVYIAWSTRGIPGQPEYLDSRIVVSTSVDGHNWTLDPSPVDVDPSKPRGHQIQPSMTFANGKLILVYLDFRQDRSQIFERFIADVDPNSFRHTVDVRAAQADPGTNPQFANYSILNGGSAQLSRYFNLMLNAEPGSATPVPYREQLQFNPLNQPLFKGGTVPFIGDYIDVAPSPAFLPNQDGTWRYNTETGDSPVFHAAWSDNRDVRPPPDDDWTSYVPPTNPDSGGFSLFNPAVPVEACVQGVNDDRTGMRNQNIYTARISHGLYVAIPGNFKLLSPDLPRSFVIYAKYSSDSINPNEPRQKTFTLSIPQQPPGGQASFDQFTLVTQTEVTIGSNSSAARTVFVTSSNPVAPIDVMVVANDSGLRGTARINADASNPPPVAQEELFRASTLDSELFFKSNLFDDSSIFTSRDDGTLVLRHDPDNPYLFESGKINSTLDTNQLEFLSQALVQLSLSNPDVYNPGIYNPGIYNPGIYNPGIYNPGIYNPGIYNPGIYNPGIYNPGIYNPGIYNPGIYNPGIYNGTITDTNYTITNDGDSATTYNVNLRLDDPSADYTYQLIVSRINTTPVADGCQLIEAPSQEVLINNINPNLMGDLLNGNSADSFYLEPGDTAIITLRIIPKVPNPAAPPSIDTISVGVVPDVVDDDKKIIGETQPTPTVLLSETQKANPLSITTAALPNASGGSPYSAQLAATGGDGARIWRVVPGTSLPSGLSLSTSGELFGTPLAGGNFEIAVRVTDATAFVERLYNIAITAPADLVVTSLTQSPVNPSSGQSITFTAVVSNLGAEPAPASTLELRIGSELPGAATNLAIGNLAGGQSVSVQRQLQLAAGNYPITATADIGEVVIESNENNNIATAEITVSSQPELITSVTPHTAAAGFGQLVTIEGSGFPTGFRPLLFVMQNGTTFGSSSGSFVFHFSATRYIARLPVSGLVAGPAMLQIADVNDTVRSAPVPITISTTPAAPVLHNIFDVELGENGCAISFGGAATSLAQGQGIAVSALGIDTSGAEIVFEQLDEGGSVISSTAVPVTCTTSSIEGLQAIAQVPTSPVWLSAVGVSIRTKVNGVTSPQSNRVVLNVEPPPPVALGFSITGPGTINATESGPNEWDLSYDLNPAGFDTVAWTVQSTPITVAGDYTFAWNYTGFHAWFQVTARLTASDESTLVNVGPTNCCFGPPSGGFNYSGTHTFFSLEVGDTIEFSMSGRNGDSNNVLQGNLNLLQTGGPGVLDPVEVTYETTLTLEPPSAEAVIDRVVYRWTTSSTSGSISKNDVTDLSMELYDGNELVYVDDMVVDGSVNPIIGQAGPTAVPRPDSDVIWDYDITTLQLSQFRNILDPAAIAATSGVHYQVADGVTLPLDGKVIIYKYVDGVEVRRDDYLNTVQTTE